MKTRQNVPLALLAGAALVLGGCGPESMDDMETQLKPAPEASASVEQALCTPVWDLRPTAVNAVYSPWSSYNTSQVYTTFCARQLSSCGLQTASFYVASAAISNTGQTLKQGSSYVAFTVGSNTEVCRQIVFNDASGYGSFYIRLTADGTNMIPESNESNNIFNSGMMYF